MNHNKKYTFQSTQNQKYISVILTFFNVKSVKTFSHFVCSDFVTEVVQVWKGEKVNKICF